MFPYPLLPGSSVCRPAQPDVVSLGSTFGYWELLAGTEVGQEVWEQGFCQDQPLARGRVRVKPVGRVVHTEGARELGMWPV